MCAPERGTIYHLAKAKKIEDGLVGVWPLSLSEKDHRGIQGLHWCVSRAVMVEGILKALSKC